MSDLSPGGLPRARGKGRASRDAEELTVELDEGFDPFAGQPDLPDPGMAAPAPGAEPGDRRPPAAAPATSPADPAPPADGPFPDDAAAAAPRAAPRRGAAGAASPAAGAEASAASADAAAPPLPPDPSAAPGGPAPAGAALPGAASRPDVAAAARLLGVPPALARLDVTLTVEVGRRRLQLAELVSSEAGALIPLDRLIDEPVDVLVNGTPFARGEILALGDRFAVRLVALVDAP